MKIIIAMPMYKSMDASCVQSLVGFQSELHENGHSAKFVFTNGFNAAKARKCLAKNIAEEGQDYDYVLWLDSDHFYRKDAFFHLVNRMEEHGLSMLSATYKLHGGEESAHGITDETGFHHFHYKDYTNDLIECDVIGFGFLVMNPKLVKELWDAYGDSLFILDAKENCTEDVTFCRRAKEKGYKVMFDPTVRVGHVELAIRI